MTLALILFIYGMWRYFKRIYQRFALESDRMISGKFEFVDTALPAGDATSNREAGSGGLGEVLSGGIASLPASHQTAERKRTEETNRIISLVEPGAQSSRQPVDPGAAGAPPKDKCSLQ